MEMSPLIPVFEVKMKTEDQSSVDRPLPTTDQTDHKSTHPPYLPLNLKMSPVGSYSDSDGQAMTSPTCSIDDTIKNRLQEFFVTPESNVIALEEKTKSLRELYTVLSVEEKTFFLRFLSTQFGVDHSAVEHVAGQISSTLSRKSDGHLVRLEDRLRSALIPRYQQLLTMFSRLEHGIKFLLQLRVDVLVSIEP